MDNIEKEIGSIGIDENGAPAVREPIFIKLTEYKKARFLDIRKYYQKNGDFAPTQKGITLNKEQIEELINILQNNKDEIKKWFEEEK